MIEYKSGEELGFMKKSPHSPECVSSIQKKGVKSMDAIFNRTSIRKYKQESLKKEEIDLILKAAFSAPSARNSQP